MFVQSFSGRRYSASNQHVKFDHIRCKYCKRQKCLSKLDDRQQIKGKRRVPFNSQRRQYSKRRHAFEWNSSSTYSNQLGHSRHVAQARRSHFRCVSCPWFLRLCLHQRLQSSCLRLIILLFIYFFFFVRVLDFAF